MGGSNEVQIRSPPPLCLLLLVMGATCLGTVPGGHLNVRNCPNSRFPDCAAVDGRNPDGVRKCAFIHGRWICISRASRFMFLQKNSKLKSLDASSPFSFARFSLCSTFNVVAFYGLSSLVPTHPARTRFTGSSGHLHEDGSRGRRIEGGSGGSRIFD